MGNRIALAYLLLVGLPVLLMLGTLQAGRHISAPLAIGGSWVIRLDPDARLNGCGDWLPDRRELSAEISQSGKTVVIALSDTRRTVINSILSDSRLVGASAPLRIAGCPNLSLAIDANVVNPAADRALTGQFSLAGCPACGSISFRASARGRVAGKE